MITNEGELPALERKVLDAADWWHAEINRTRSTSAFHVSLEECERGLFEAVSALLDARYHLANLKHAERPEQPER